MSNFIKPKMVRILNSLSIDRVHIDKGSFMMGSNEYDSEKPIHKVTIKNDFEIGKYPITIAEYLHFANDTKTHYPEWMEEGSKFNIKTGSVDHYKKINLDSNAPIVGVSWHDAKAYCDWLSEKTGDTYRLPTEAEWEYACRAGTTTKWSFGDNEKELEKYAWYRENTYGKGKKHPDYGTHIVGTKDPNPWKLYDMHGNVWEWCEDDWTESYEKTPRDGSTYKDENSGSKVLRGGSWYSSAVNSRSAFRGWFDPESRSSVRGFRLLRTLPS